MLFRDVEEISPHKGYSRIGIIIKENVNLLLRHF